MGYYALGLCLFVFLFVFWLLCRAPPPNPRPPGGPGVLSVCVLSSLVVVRLGTAGYHVLGFMGVLWCCMSYCTLSSMWCIASTAPFCVPRFRTLVTHVSAGALPDHVACSSDGSFCVCANEGEPSDDLTNDPVGGITVVTASDWMDSATYASSTYSLSGVVDSVSAGQHRVHTSIPSPTTTFDADLEPEYVAMSAATTSNSGKVYVGLQENNAIIEFDMGTRQWTQLMPLGWKNLTIVTGDYSDKDGAVQMRAGHARLVSMYQPDSMLVVTQQGKDYIIIANEGDAKDYDGFSEEARAADLNLNAAFFSAQDISDFGDSNIFGRLKVTTQAGKSASGDTYDYVVGYGGRSWSVLDPSTGTMVWDSADQIAMMEAKYWEAGFQSAGTTGSQDSRSDDKGAEPESIAYGVVSGTPYVFVGLERTSLIGAWDVTDIANPVFAGFGGTGDCGASEVEMAHRDPEAMVFVEAGSSPTGQAMLIAGGSYTGTVATFDFHLHDGQTGGECMRCYWNAPTSCGYRAPVVGDGKIGAPAGEHSVAFPTSEATKSFVPRPISIRESGIVDGGVEYVCYDTASKRVFAVNSASSTLDSYTLDAGGMISARTVEYSNFVTDGYKPQSCAVNAAQGVVVVATEAGQAAGKLYAFKLSDRYAILSWCHKGGAQTASSRQVSSHVPAEDCYVFCHSLSSLVS